MSRKPAIVLAVLAVLGISGAVAAVVASAESSSGSTEPVANRNGFGPTDEPQRGKHIELLIDANTRMIDTFGIGPDVVELDGLGQVSSYSVQ